METKGNDSASTWITCDQFPESASGLASHGRSIGLTGPLHYGLKGTWNGLLEFSLICLLLPSHHLLVCLIRTACFTCPSRVQSTYSFACSLSHSFAPSYVHGHDLCASISYNSNPQRVGYSNLFFESERQSAIGQPWAVIVMYTTSFAVPHGTESSFFNFYFSSLPTGLLWLLDFAVF